jgi:hypothetical protein
VAHAGVPSYLRKYIPDKPTIIHRSAPKKAGRRRLRYGRVRPLTHVSNTWYCLTSRATCYHTTPPRVQLEILENSPCGWMRHRSAGLMTYDEQSSWLTPRVPLESTCPVRPKVFDRRLGISLRWTAPPGQSPTTLTARGVEWQRHRLAWLCQARNRASCSCSHAH